MVEKAKYISDTSLARCILFFDDRLFGLIIFFSAWQLFTRIRFLPSFLHFNLDTAFSLVESILCVSLLSHCPQLEPWPFVTINTNYKSLLTFELKHWQKSKKKSPDVPIITAQYLKFTNSFYSLINITRNGIWNAEQNGKRRQWNFGHNDIDREEKWRRSFGYSRRLSHTSGKKNKEIFIKNSKPLEKLNINKMHNSWNIIFETWTIFGPQVHV